MDAEVEPMDVVASENETPSETIENPSEPTELAKEANNTPPDSPEAENEESAKNLDVNEEESDINKEFTESESENTDATNETPNVNKDVEEVNKLDSEVNKESTGANNVDSVEEPETSDGPGLSTEESEVTKETSNNDDAEVNMVESEVNNETIDVNKEDSVVNKEKPESTEQNADEVSEVNNENNSTEDKNREISELSEEPTQAAAEPKSIEGPKETSEEKTDHEMEDVNDDNTETEKPSDEQNAEDDDIVMLDDDSNSGIKIASVAGDESEKSTDSTGLKISSIASNPEDSGLKIANVMGDNSEKSQDSEAEKSTLKIANVMGDDSEKSQDSETEKSTLRIANVMGDDSEKSQDSETEKSTLKIANVMGDDSEKSQSSESAIKIANVSSAEIVELDDENDENDTGLQIESVESQSNGDSGSGLKISSFASMPAEESTEKSTESTGLKISSIASTNMEDSGLKIADVTSTNSEKSTENSSSIKIANVSSTAPDDEIVNLDDEESTTSEKSTDKPSKPVLKLASFATSTTNGISEVDNTTPISANEPAKCSQSGKEITDYKSAVAWETMLFYDEDCLGKYQERMNSCSTCKVSVQPVFVGKYCVRFGSNIKQFCSNKCLEDHKKGLKVCCYCQKDISSGDGFLAPIGNKGQFKDFCKQKCLKKFEARQNKTELEKEIEDCAVCKQSKTVEKTILTANQTIKVCSVPCAGAYKFRLETSTYECDLCGNDFVQDLKDCKQIFYSGISKRFCSEACQNVFVMQTREIVPCSWCKVRKYNFDMIEKYEKDQAKHFCSVNCLRLVANAGKKSIMVKTAVSTSTSTSTDGSIPVIQSVSSLAGAGLPPAQPDKLPTQPIPAQQVLPPPPPQIINRTTNETIVKFPEPVTVKNKAINCRPFMLTKGVSCRPHPCHKSTQTDIPSTPGLLPITVPMYLPVPMQMYQRPYPVPIPIPIPVPVPIFIPTTRNSAKGIEKQLKKMKAKMPSDPLEAELLALAGAIAPEDGANDLDSDDSLPEDNIDDDEDKPLKYRVKKPQYSEDIENIMSGNKIVPKPLPQVTPDMAGTTPHHPTGHQNQYHSASRNHQTRSAMKRRYSSKDDCDSEDYQPSNNRRSRGGVAKQARTHSSISQEAQNVAAFPQPPKERPDAKNHLKFTYGVNAWRHWVVGKNAELEKQRAQGKYIKPFETDILKLRADELNYTLCMFVKEVRKPNGDAYAADSILYLTLGIQEYLFTSGRIDNLFTDVYYEAFTTALHEVIKDFKLPTNQMGYFVTRIEEEHLWEAKQLGAHSPQVLLNTLIYFNVKYFMLKTMEDHKKLSFTHIMKHFKKGGTAVPCSRNTSPGDKQTLLLRYYPPAERGRHQERKCYEQHEIPDPTRCPVKLYEFYLSKCPDNVRSRSDLFYLQPERSCVPDSPVWYSTHPLNEHAIDKMLQRILMVREVQEHMLADAQQG